jgi:hypothetical protein
MGDAMDDAGKGHVEMPTVSEAAAQVRNGEVSAEELVAASLAAIERTNGDLNAFVHVDAEGHAGIQMRSRHIEMTFMWHDCGLLCNPNRQDRHARVWGLGVYRQPVTWGDSQSVESGAHPGRIKWWY